VGSIPLKHIKGCQFISKTQFKLKILKRTQAVETSRRTNLRIVYLTTPKCLYSQKSKLSKRIGGHSKRSTLKAYLHFYLDVVDSFEDEFDYYMLVKLAI